MSQVKATKVLAIALVTIGAIGWICMALLSARVMSYRPSQPQPDMHLIYPYQEHGRTVYVSRAESLLMSVLPWLAPGLIFAGIAIRANSSWGPHGPFGNK
jgi:hypothetical protein